DQGHHRSTASGVRDEGRSRVQGQAIAGSKGPRWERDGAPAVHRKIGCATRLQFVPAAQSKLSARFGSPVPLYFAACGYGHSGRVMPASWEEAGPAEFVVATTLDGATPFSTQSSSAS